jgi:hypothetical protein
MGREEFEYFSLPKHSFFANPPSNLLEENA